jgi:hypothetical protein
MELISHQDLLNVVLFPEIFEPLTWPIIFFPTKSVKQKKEIHFLSKNSNVIIYPGKFNSELNVNNEIYHLLKGEKYMKEKYIYACVIYIQAKRIRWNKNVYDNVLRVIYTPSDNWGEDISSQFNFTCIELQSIKIIRHIQFIPHNIYKELFDTSYSNQLDIVGKFRNYLNFYKHAN